MEPETLWVRYMAAFVMLVSFVLGGQIIEHRVEQSGHSAEHALTLSGEQRMLIQRMRLLAGKYSETGQDRYANYLMRARGKFLENHEWLMSHAVQFSPALWAYYGPRGRDLDRNSRDYAELAWQAIVTTATAGSAESVLDRMERMGLNALLMDLEGAVKIFERAAEDRIASLQQLNRLSDLALIVVLILQIAFVFYPAHRTITGMVRRLSYQARHDGLTGLINRMAMQEALDAVTVADGRAPETVVLIAIDLDGFKEVNDTYGHPAGDQVIRRVAQLLQEAVDEEQRLTSSCIARMGGDEFMIAALIAPDHPRRVVVEALGARLIADTSQPIAITLETGEAGQCRVGMSIGYATTSQTRWRMEQIMNDADLALYDAKRRGKGRIIRFEPAMRGAAERRQKLERDLRAGLERQEFSAYFQPQVDLATGDVAGVEALARWRHPEEGLVLPAEFLPIAGSARLIRRLDLQVMDEAILAMAGFREAGLSVGQMGMNLSGGLLRDPGFPSWLVSSVQARGLEPGAFNLEVSEAILPDEREAAKTALEALAAAGFSLSIDDFGRGYASLANILQSDPSQLKVDSSLVANAGNAASDRVLGAAVSMARGMGARAVAVGIEDWVQYRAIRALGFDMGQGFVIAEPMPVADFTEWARDRAAARTPFSLVGGAS